MAFAQPTARTAAFGAGVGLAALALAAAAALPAAADPPGNGGNGHGNGGNSANAPGHSQTHGKSADAAGHGQTHGNNANGEGTTQATGHNPPGNNGTVFVHDVAGDEHPHNVPHVSCNFWVDFFGFDNAQSVTVSFAGQAPTGKDTALGGTVTKTLEADDAGGAGHDWDGELAFTADQLGVSSLGAPAHQGYHVKMTVTTNQPGDHKYKVFWIQPCSTASSTQTSASTPPQSTTQSTTPPTSAGGTTAATTPDTPDTSAGSGEQAATAPATQPTSDSAGESTGGALVSAAQASRSTTGVPTDVLGTRFTRATPTPAATATASSLPFTGAEIGAMALAAAVALGGGVILMVAGRRRRRAG